MKMYLSRGRETVNLFGVALVDLCNAYIYYIDLACMPQAHNTIPQNESINNRPMERRTWLLM